MIVSSSSQCDFGRVINRELNQTVLDIDVLDQLLRLSACIFIALLGDA